MPPEYSSAYSPMYLPYASKSKNAAPQKRIFSLATAIALLKSRGYVIADSDGVLT